MADVQERLRTLLAGQYAIERQLERGGMATVFLAREIKHDRLVAVKVLDPEIADGLGPERFLREIEIAAQLQHPHILSLIDSGAGDGLLYYVMPYVEGESLRKRLVFDRQLPVDEAIRLTTEVARALDYAHRKRIVHRDIKPGNILLADNQAVVTDFGIARAIHEAGGETLTRTGDAVGTPAYMSPEQISRAGHLDGRTDVYSLGCVLYEMVAGQPPFSGPPQTLSHQHLNVAPRPVRELRPTVSTSLENVLQKALSKSPADRFSTGAEFVAALESVRVGTDTEADTVPISTGRDSRWKMVALLGSLAVLISVGVWKSGVFTRKPAPAASSSRRWVWIADFDAPADRADLGATARDLVASVLDQSQDLATVPVEQVRIGLRNSGRPETLHVTGELARELAFRSAIPVVLEGHVARVGAGYSIVLRATAAEDGRPIHTTNLIAAQESQLIQTLVRGGRDIRRGLRDRGDEFRYGGGWVDAPTKSLDAFKLYRFGRKQVGQGEFAAALISYRSAISIDSSFAEAWAGVGTCLYNLGKTDSSVTAFHVALKYGDRLTSIRRLDLEAKLARASGDEQTALSINRAILERNPPPADRALALNNCSIILSNQGHLEEALQLMAEAVEVMPVEPNQLHLGSYGGMLVSLGRIDEARRLIPRARGTTSTRLRLMIAMKEHAWSQAESLARSLQRDPELRGDTGAGGLAVVLGTRGQMLAANGVLEDRLQAIVLRGNLKVAALFWMRSFWLCEVVGMRLPSVPSSLTGPAADVVAGTLAVSGVKPVLADKARQQALTAVSPEITTHFDGWTAWRTGDWNKTLAILRPYFDGVPFARPPDVEFAMREGTRWVLADAYEHLGRPDSAATCLRRILDPPALESWQPVAWTPVVRCRLIRLYKQQGLVEEAHREWQVLSMECTRPDPAIARLLQKTEQLVQPTVKAAALLR